MEAIFAPSSNDQSFSPYKQIKNPSKRNTRSSISRPTENFASINNIIHRGGGGGGGLLFAPPPSVSFSYPPPLSVLHPPQQTRIRQQAQPQPQPPLLPLPLSKPRHSSLPLTTRKTNRSKDQSLTPKKSKRPIIKGDDHETKQTDQSLIIASYTLPLGPDPNDLPKDVSKVLSSSPPSSFSSMSGNGVNNVTIKDLESFSGLVLTLSPPPSSLPLPKFSVKPKLSCTAEAAGIDAGATDNLRRLLRLR